MTVHKSWHVVERPLTEAQRALCEDPAAVGTAIARARQWARGKGLSPAAMEAMESDALLAVVELAQRYDANFGMSFKSYVYHLALKRMAEIRRRETETGRYGRKRKPKRVASLDAETGDGLCLGDSLPDPHPHSGAEEFEYREYVERHLQGCTTRQRVVARAILLDASIATSAQLAQEMGFGETYISNLFRQFVERVREREGVECGTVTGPRLSRHRRQPRQPE